jgi:tripartite-type tricarboxylate transporter receptor subunit TctC
MQAVIVSEHFPMIQRNFIAAAALIALSGAVLAQDYPTKPITVVVPFAAGGPTDKAARDLVEAMRKSMPTATFVIENVGGAGGTLGITKVAKAANDGYSLLFMHIGMATTPTMYRNLSYKTLDDFEFLGLVSENPMTVVGRPNLPANNYAELVKWMNDNKGKINLAHAGLGSASHLCGLLFQQGSKIDMTTIPYKGTAPAMTDLVGGQVDLMCDQTTNTSAQIEGGKVKGFAVTSMQPLTTPALSKMPTLDSQGMKGFNVEIWQGLYAPKGTPKAITDKLNAALKASTKDAAFIKSQESLGASVITDARNNPADHKKFVEAEIAKWGVAIKAAGQYAD